ncbi:MAG: DUF4350 domain-containing protein [Dehalococcoidales bacterium]|nr:MAG: DUF4350 domain-containing protein [Dehalococcoidales bacterium]
MTLRRFLVLLAVVSVAILIVIVWVFPSDEDFQTKNPFWNGSSELSSYHSFTPLASLAELPAVPGGTTLILVPYIDLTSSELEEIRHFVAGGGTLVLADDYGFGNKVLEHLKVEARFAGQVLLDPLFSYKNQWLPRIYNLSPDSVTGDVNSLVFNHATCLMDVSDSNVLALSSSFSFLDLNDNEEWDSDEPTGPLPVISQHTLASGRIIVISDPSIFINSMDTLDDNYTIIENIAEITSSQLLIDQSHLPYSDLHQTKDVLASVRSALTTPVGTLALVAVLLIITLRPIWPRKGEGIGDIA